MSWTVAVILTIVWAVAVVLTIVWAVAVVLTIVWAGVAGLAGPLARRTGAGGRGMGGALPRC